MPFATMMSVNETAGFDLPDVTDPVEEPLQSAFLYYFVQGLYGTVFVVGMLGNSLVIYVVLRYSKMQTVTNLYILNLAVADQCFLIGIPFLMTTMGLGCWPFGNVMCKIYMTTTSVNQFTSSLLLTVMSADRYIAVCHPINSPTFRTPAIAKGVAIATWAVSFLMIVPIFLYAHTQQVNPDWAMAGNLNITTADLAYWSNVSAGLTATTVSFSGWPANWTAAVINASLSSLHLSSTTTTSSSSFVLNGLDEAPVKPIVSCNIYWPENEYMNGQAAFTLYTFTLAFAIPLVLILVFYILVIRKLQTVGPKTKSKEKKKSHRKVTRLVLTVVTVYVLCWLPYWVSQMALIFTPPKASQSSFTVAIFLLAGCLSYSNSAVNPILYAFLSDNFKKSFMKACVCAERREVNKALTGENSVFTRRGRNSERTPANGATNNSSVLNDVRSRTQQMTLRSSDAEASQLHLSIVKPAQSEDSSSSSPHAQQHGASQCSANGTVHPERNGSSKSSSLKLPEDIPLLDKSVATIAASVNDSTLVQSSKLDGSIQRQV